MVYSLKNNLHNSFLLDYNLNQLKILTGGAGGDKDR